MTAVRPVAGMALGIVSRASGGCSTSAHPRTILALVNPAAQRRNAIRCNRCGAALDQALDPHTLGEEDIRFSAAVRVGQHTRDPESDSKVELVRVIAQVSDAAHRSRNVRIRSVPLSVVSLLSPSLPDQRVSAPQLAASRSRSSTSARPIRRQRCEHLSPSRFEILPTPRLYLERHRGEGAQRERSVRRRTGDRPLSSLR